MGSGEALSRARPRIGLAAAQILLAVSSATAAGPQSPIDSNGAAETTLSIRSGESVRVWLDTREPVTLAVLDPRGRVLRRESLAAGVVAPISIAASASGTYTVRHHGRASVSAAPARPSAAADDRRRGLEASLLEASNLTTRWEERERRPYESVLRRLVREARALSDSSLEGRALVVLGDLLRGLGDASRSLAAYRDAVSVNDPASVVDAHVGAALALVRLDRREDSERHARAALSGAERALDRARMGRALAAIGLALHDRSRFEEALETYARAERLLDEAGDETSLAETLIHEASALSDASREDEALALHHRALTMARRLTDRRIEAYALVGLGHSYANVGSPQRALEAYFEAIPLVERMGDPYWSASLFAGLGFVQDQLGNPRSIEYHEHALALNRRVGSPSGEAGNLIMLGRALASQDRLVPSLQALAQALPLVEAMDEVRFLSVLLSELAATHDRLGNESAARTYHRRALSVSRDGGLQRQSALALNALGRLDEKRGADASARRHFERAAEMGTDSDAPFAVVEALSGLARISRRAGRLDGARRLAEEALERVEELRSGVASHSMRSTYFASTRELHELYVNVLFDLYEARPGEGFGERAFLAAERARARSLAEQLVERSTEAAAAALDVELSERLAALRRKVREEAAELGPALGERPFPGALDTLLAELEHVNAVASGRLQRSGAAYASAASSSPPGLETLQNELLDEASTLLAYFLGEERSFVWAVRPGRFTARVLPPRRSIEADVRELYRAVTERERREGEPAKQHARRVRESEARFDELAAMVSRTLLGPVRDELEADRLLVVGEGPLQAIPFSALPSPATPGLEPEPLVARHTLARLPSVASLALLRERERARPPADKRLAVIADPVFDARDPRLRRAARSRTESSAAAPAAQVPFRSVRLFDGSAIPRLLASRDEARTILELVPERETLAAFGFQASRELVTGGALDRFDILHFATHGVLDHDHPNLSGIVLSLFDENGRPRDGYLRLAEIERLRLPASLVVLSACRTALGKEVVSEGPIGLVSGFLSAGASGVVASYWNVDDEATAELMKRFYRAMFERGLDVAEALSSAQRSLRGSKRWSSPFFWAGFELHGLWR